MLNQFKEPPIVISVGGSLIAPDEGIDTVFLSKLNKLIRSQVIKGRRFLLVAGGGKIARRYRDAGKAVIGDITNEDLDWIAIHTTRLNAHLLRTIFQDIAHPRIVINYDKRLFNWKEPIAIGAGWKPGWSTDYDAVILAKDYKAQLIINLSNIEGIYDKDPKKFKDAKFIEKITWHELEKLVGNKWTPGLNAPFDPIATQLAKKHRLTVVVANGQDFDNTEKIIEGLSFKGTVIMPFKVDASFYDRDYYLGKKGGHIVGQIESALGSFFHNTLSCYRALIIKMTINPKSCLEIGCGIGRLVKWMRFFNIDAYGLDFSPHIKKVADKSIKKYIIEGDITNIPFPDNHFDCVISYDLLQKIERNSIKKAIKETIRVAKNTIFHKIHTKENIWFSIFHRNDYSDVSLFFSRFWDNLFQNFQSVKLIKTNHYLRFIETKYKAKKVIK